MRQPPSKRDKHVMSHNDIEILDHKFLDCGESFSLVTAVGVFLFLKTIIFEIFGSLEKQCDFVIFDKCGKVLFC